VLRASTNSQPVEITPSSTPFVQFPVILHLWPTRTLEFGSRKPGRWRGLTPMTEAGREERVTFASPPVRVVVLTIYFRSLETLQPIHLSRLRELWRDEYPSTGTLPPLRPHPNSAAHIDDIESDVPSWPFPYMIFSTADEDQAVAVQSDRLVRTWQFKEGESYPGYEALAADLGDRLEQFSTVVRDELGRDIEVTTSECYYANELPDLATVELLVGVASGWSSTVPDSGELPPTHYAGVRMHIDDPDFPGTHVQLNADVDEEGSTLSITSRYSAGGGDGEDSSRDTPPMGGLELAHAALIHAFMQFTSDDMKSVWSRER
jgi:hypothetical protein